ncbi:hypothetical protein AAHK07_05445 [Aliarcobacter cryaerophilus]|uniref:winged helix-turn-helix domain-containing protein n=1 Tax=Aliarcobacter cryaerophilus TaxID=28198 RepID=UPI0031759217
MEENNLLQIKLDENIYYSFVNKNIIKNIVFKASVNENTLRNMVYRLRKKIDTDTIATIKDLGYIIKIK